jgi:transcriptional regulator with XRE-family HTH domain
MSPNLYPRTRTTTWPIGERMRAFREDADMTQKAVARRMFVSPRTVRDWEAGRRHPTVLMLEAYLRVVGGSITLGGAP